MLRHPVYMSSNLKLQSQLSGPSPNRIQKGLCGSGIRFDVSIPFIQSHHLVKIAFTHFSSSTDKKFPAGSLNQAILGPPWKIPLSSVLSSPSL
jgi:hypothetical protein